MQDPYGEGWMLVVRPAAEKWQASLVTGSTIGEAFDEWLAKGSYKERKG